MMLSMDLVNKLANNEIQVPTSLAESFNYYLTYLIARNRAKWSHDELNGLRRKDRGGRLNVSRSISEHVKQ